MVQSHKHWGSNEARQSTGLSIHVKYKNRQNKDKMLGFRIVFTPVGRMEVTGKW